MIGASQNDKILSIKIREVDLNSSAQPESTSLIAAGGNESCHLWITWLLPTNSMWTFLWIFLHVEQIK